jgi:hypothetical protein
MFTDWLTKVGVFNLDQDSLQILCHVYNEAVCKESDLISFSSTTSFFISNPKNVLRSLVQNGYLEKNGSSYRLSSFHTKNSFYAISLEVNSPYKLFQYWVGTLSVDISTSRQKMVNLGHAKRLLKGRTLSYWQGIVDQCAKDKFWKTAAKNSIATLEKAALNFGVSNNSNGRSKADEVLSEGGKEEDVW